MSNVSHAYRQERALFANDQFNLISVCDRISDMEEAIKVLPFSHNFPFQI